MLCYNKIILKGDPDSMDRIMKTSKIIYKVLSVLFWLDLAALGFGLLVEIAAIFAAIFAGDAVLPENSLTITLGSVELNLRQSYHSRQFIPFLGTAVVNLVVGAASLCGGIRIVQGILRPMTQGKPFDCNISSALRKLAFLVLIMGVISYLLDNVTNVIFFHSLDISSLFSQEKVSGCTLSVVGDVSFLIWFGLLLLLSRVFQYGQQLQQLSDETL